MDVQAFDGYQMTQAQIDVEGWYTRLTKESILDTWPGIYIQKITAAHLQGECISNNVKIEIFQHLMGIRYWID